MKQKRGSSSSNFSSLYNLPSKQGQVTIFIIIGVLIVFAFAGILYITKVVTKEELTAAGAPIIAAVPQEFQPLQTYTENCLAQVGRRGLLVLGQQGGYIYPELAGTYSVNDPTNADGVDLEPIKVPYWYYNVLPNENPQISYASKKPALYAVDDPELSIETQLSRFTEENIAECLDDYAAFAAEGFVVNAPALQEGSEDLKEIKVTVADQSVNFWLKMDLEAGKGDAEIEMNQFYVPVPIRLKQMYAAAAELTAVEKNHSFLELQALDLLTAYAGVDYNRLPPMEQMTFNSPVPVIWAESDVKLKTENLLTSSVPLLRYLGSTNFYRFEYPQQEGVSLDLRDLYQKHYDNMILPLDAASGMEVNFDYFGWNTYFDMNDKGGNIEPSIFYGPMVPPLPKIPLDIQRYYSTYDISYPVLITLRDPNALEGRGFTFAFALEANLRNNQVPVEGYVQPAPIALEQKSMVCDPKKRNTQLVKTVVVDSSNLEPLEAVQIGFSIPEQDDCAMGSTNHQGTFESKYPAVYGGVASFVKDEYLTNFYPVDTYRFKETSGTIGYAVAGAPELVVPLHKKVFVNMSVRKKSLEKCIADEDGKDKECFTQGLFAASGSPVVTYSPEALDKQHSWSFLNLAKPLGEEETAIVMLKRVSDTVPGVYSEEFSSAATVTGDGTASLELVPGVYEVTALITSSTSLTIPEEERCTGGLFLPIPIPETCFIYEEQVLDELLLGRLQWDQPKSYLTITPEQAYSTDTIIFNVLTFNLEGVPELEHVRILEDLNVMAELGNLSQQLRPQLEPLFE
ncbi:MAG: hypothetical protein Q7S55_01130 [Nanoarchaeota archaeon]|nr:hypothetical protein [Nanoarchaeota archaeon]